MLSMNRERETPEIVTGAYGIYGPLRKWSAFLRIINLARQSSYDLIAVAGCTNSIQTAPQGSKKAMTIDQAICKASRSVAGYFECLAEEDKLAAVERLVLRLSAEYGVEPRDQAGFRLAA